MISQELLNDNQILKVGVGPLNDGRKTYRDHGLAVNGTFDLRFMAAKCSLPATNLKKMAFDFLGMKLVEYDQTWNWDQVHLDAEQIEYAANDAQAAIKLFEYFERKLTVDEWGPNAADVLADCRSFRERLFQLPNV